MKKWKNICKTGILLFCMTAFVAGCGVKALLPSGKSGIREYGKAETMVILSTEKLRYEELYTEQIWDAKIDQNGTVFSSSLLSQVHDFMKELKLMSEMAAEHEIVLTSREKELIKAASVQYWNALGEADAEALELSQSDVEGLYADYCIAERLVDELTGDMNLEVSDSEAKVITVSEIKAEDLETAEEILAKVQEENADFGGIAKSYTEGGAVPKQIYYGLMGETYEAAAFALENGEISGVIAEDGAYYILKCLDDYDADATKLRKEEMMRQKKNEAFYTKYELYRMENPLLEDAELWNTLSVSGCPKVTADFFAVYDAVWAENENGV